MQRRTQFITLIYRHHNVHRKTHDRLELQLYRPYLTELHTIYMRSNLYETLVLELSLLILMNTDLYHNVHSDEMKIVYSKRKKKKKLLMRMIGMLKKNSESNWLIVLYIYTVGTMYIMKNSEN